MGMHGMKKVLIPVNRQVISKRRNGAYKATMHKINGDVKDQVWDGIRDAVSNNVNYLLMKWYRI